MYQHPSTMGASPGGPSLALRAEAAPFLILEATGFWKILYHPDGQHMVM